MARILGGLAQNELRIQDNLSNSILTAYYRLPTTTERLNYSTKSIKREGVKVTFNHGQVRQEYGAKIITGFLAGDFTDADGNPMASDPASPLYNKGWLELIQKYAADVLETLAIWVFESSVAVKRDEAEDAVAGDDEDGEDADPTVGVAPAVAGDRKAVKKPAPDDAPGN